MRILFFPHNGKPYGANKSLVTLLCYLRIRHQVFTIIPFSNLLKKEFRNKGIEFITLPFFPTIFYVRKKLKYALFPILQIINIIIFPVLIYKTWKFRPDIIYSNSSMENMGWVLAKLFNIKHITHVREFGDLDYSFMPIMGNSFKHWYLNHSNGVIFNSKVVQNYVLPARYQNTLCVTIYNGIEITENNTAKEKNPSRISLGIVGYIHKEKGQMDALVSLKDLLKSRGDLILNIYGEGEKEYIKKMNQYIQMNQLDNKVRFAGYINNVKEIYDSIDILVVFARNEAFGRVTIEAMRYGIPVIGYNGGGTPELITDGKDGYLFENTVEFIEKLQRMIDDHKLYQLMSNNSKRKVEEQFSEQVYTKKTESFLINIPD